ncbi:hypothetical protein ACJIZ3_003343 [Penstemon smallii]|uniref:Uncharacterized protein n=1 Tax=Penstemon smallii TaxID=265156 RepID=A0ABD3UAE9_9LAMI
MINPSHLLPLLLLLLLYSAKQSHSQQSYVNNRQLDCNQNYTTTLGFICNSPATTCPSYLTFRSTPTYNNPPTIAYLLSADASSIASVNNISTVDPIPNDTLLIIPVNCTCFNSTYYQHNASYVLQRLGENYFTVANDTYQALTTCQSLEAQNRYNIRGLVPNLNLAVPLRCACVTPNQTGSGFNYLLTYLVRQGDSYDSIARAFAGAGATVQGILDANELSADRLIYFFTPILVPLTREPTAENINTAALPPLPPTLPTTPTTQINGGSNSRRMVFVGVGVGIAVLVLVLLSSLAWCFIRRRKSASPPAKEHSSGELATTWQPLPMSQEIIPQNFIDSLTVYRFEDLEKATGSFSEANRIGESSAYRGLFNGDDAVVKIMKGDVSREIDVLRQINHSHIIRLSGFCLHEGITYLVYEYAQKGSLDEWLRPSNTAIVKGGDEYDSHLLDWKQRVQIAYDVADALNYLHNFTRPPYIHKNLKSSNVLLDANMRAKVANFGLARSLGSEDDPIVTRHVEGTYGYMAPEYIENGLITPKLDVFALGVVILELLSGKEAIMDKIIDDEEGEQLLLWKRIEGVLARENVREKLREFVDPLLGEDYPLDLAYSMAQLARSCVAHNLNERPTVSEVFFALSRLLSSSMDWDPSHGLQQSTSFSLSD